jgi:hypothetical protein
MGSSGSGRLTDYPGSSKSNDKNGGGGAGGGKPQADRCARAISTALEDVEHSTYFKIHKTIPPAGTRLHVAQEKRIVAVTDEGEIVGNLPTQYNYLAACLTGGYTYVGQVRNASNGPPVATVAADFGAVAPK